MEFPPLPQGKPYSLESEEDSWSLNGLTSIANDIALTLRNQAPYGKGIVYNCTAIVCVTILTFSTRKLSRCLHKAR